MQISKKVAVIFGVVGLAAGTAGTIAFQTHAAGSTASAGTQTGQHMRFTSPAAAGPVTAINGNNITVTDKKSGTSFTVDASNATIQKFSAPTTSTTPPTKPTPTAITVSNIAVGDNVSVQGTVSGTTITATKILDGVMMGGFGGFRGRMGGPHGGAFGTVSSISGNTITLTGKDGKTYTIDASSANVNKITKSNVSGIAVGDTLMVNGSANGTSITAKNITDGVGGFGKPGQPATTTSPPAN